MAKAGEGAGPCAIGEARGPEGEGCPPSSQSPRATEKLSSVTNYGPSFTLMVAACFCPML